MNKMEKFSVLLIVIATTIVSITVTKYMFEPLEEKHLTPEPYGEVFIEGGLYNSRVGTQTWIKVYNRAGTFEERYEFNEFTDFANGTEATKVIQGALDALSDGGKLYLDSGNYFLGSLNIEDNTIVLEDHTTLQGNFSVFS